MTLKGEEKKMKTGPEHKRSILILAVAFILFSIIPSFAESINYVYDDLNRLIRIEYENGNKTALLRGYLCGIVTDRWQSG